MNKTSHAIVRTLLLGTSCLSVAGLMVGSALAQPTGGQVVYGGATITDHGPNSTVIDQKTGKAIINWNSFSIGAGGTVKFNQPNASAIALNRVLGGESSSICGNLLANGQVWIINKNGILFGQGSTINVGGLIATTADITDSNFAAGNYSFSGGTGAAVINQGTIRAKNGGGVVLSGASVQNQGLVQADTGTVVLGGASAFTVDFAGDGLIKYAITEPTGAADNGQTGVANSGTLKAAGGHVVMTARAAANVQDAVVNNTGMISATSARLVNGEVVLDAGDGDVTAAGSIDASGTRKGETGGAVSITGHNVTVADNATINVSGDSGGGTVRIGGDLHGQGTLPTAANTHVGRATITADSTRTGNGGTLVVWSNGLTDFSALFSAKGGTLIGNGGFLETSGHHLNVTPDARVDTTAPKGQTGTWLLDPDKIIVTSNIEGSGASLDGNGKLALGTDPGQTDFIAPATITNALATTNVTLEAVSYIEVDDSIIYASPHSLSLMSEGNLSVFASIQNTQASGGGDVNLVAGWDGVTAPSAILSTPGSYGADDGENGRGDIVFDGESGDVFVGSASGTTTVAGLSAVLASDAGGNVQIGYHGAGGGNINIAMNDGLGLIASSPTDAKPYYAMIGNGALDGSVSGAVTGDITIKLDGVLVLATGFVNCNCNQAAPGGQAAAPQNAGDGRTIGIGNETTGTATGSVVLIAGDVDEGDDENGGIGRIVINDLAYGDVTFGHLDDQTPLEISDNATFTSAHSLTLLATGNIFMDSVFQNAGTGAMTLVSGWDGHTLSNFGAGTFGNNNAFIAIGGEGATGDMSVGTASGALTLYGHDLFVAGFAGNAQLGYHGAGGGNIFITMTGGVTIQATGDEETVANAHIGNGTLVDDVSGNVTGNISVMADGFFGTFDGDNGVAWLGNAAGTGFTEAGDVKLIFHTGFFNGYIQNDLQGGNVFIGITNDGGASYIGGFQYNAPHDFVFATEGGMNVQGSVQNAGTGAVTLVAGWDGQTVGTAAQIQAANAFGLNGAVMTLGTPNQFQNVNVGSAGGLTTVLTGYLILAPKAGDYAQIGYHGNGGGDIHVAATGDLTLTGGAAASDYAMIGNGSLNGDVTGAVTGNIDIRVAGSTDLEAGTGLNNAWIGSLSTATGNAGNLVLVTGNFNDAVGVGSMFASDLNNGDLTIGLSDPLQGGQVEDNITYSSPHALNLLFASNALVLGNIQNSGSGAITLLAGWDGHTLDPAHFLDSGVYGNGGGSVVVGGVAATGDASIGSFGGLTTIAGSNVLVQAVNGNASIGYHGNGGGAINVVALNGVIVAASGANYLAQIGNLGTAASSTATGDVSVSAANLSVAANGSSTTATVGNIDTNGGSESGNVTINTHGGSLSMSASGTQSHAHIGNWTRGDTNGTSGGTIVIDAGAVSLTSTTGGNYTQIGNGAFRFGNDTGAVSGNITIHATIFSASATGSAQARLGNLGLGAVSGDILIAATGNYTSIADGGLVSVGNVYAGLDATSNPLQGVATGNLTVTSGGTITLNAINGGTSRIETGGAASGNVTVTATGDVVLASPGNAGGPSLNSTVLIGTLTAGNSSANTSVTSTAGGVRMLALESGSNVAIGNLMNGNLAGTMSGTVTVTAGNVLTQGDATSVARIGNMGDNGATLSGAVSVLSGNVINLNDANTAIGEIDLASGPAAVINGNVTLTANTILSASTVPVRGATLSIVQTGAGGGVGSSAAPLLFNASTLNLSGAGASFFLKATGGTSLGAAALGTGALNLVAGGPVTQSGTITATGLTLSTTSGAITLTNANAVAGTVQLSGPAAVSFTNSVATSLGATSAGGTLTISSGGAISQSGAITAASLVATTTGGAITLANASNNVSGSAQFTGPAAVSFTNLGAIGLGTTAAGGLLTLRAGGAITQSGTIAAVGLDVATTSGAIALTNTGNAVTGMVQFNAPGAVGFYNTLGINAGAISAGGDLTLLAKGNINFLKNVQSNTGAITAVAGWDGTTTNAANFGNSGVFGNGTGAIAVGGTGATGSVAVGSKSGTTTLYGKILTVGAANGNAQLGYHGTGGGAIVVRTLADVNVNAAGGNSAMIGNGSLTTDVTGNITGDIDVRAGGNLNFTGVTANEQFGNLAHSGSEMGNVTVIVSDVNGASNQFAGYLLNAVGGGDILLGFTGTNDEGPGTNFAYNSSHSLIVLAAGNLVAPASIQNAGTGAITLVAGWDGKTLTGFGNSGVAGNNGKGVTIGGSIAAGNVAVGSAGGQTSIYGASLAITAVNGYAQLGFNGHGTGAILVNVTGALTMTGGSGTGQFAQLGHGGLKTSGNNAGDISVTAGGAVTLTSGAGTEAYVQLGHGGAESNNGAANGYSNQGNITVQGQDVILNAGTGQAAYVQIGHGGYKVGAGITGGTATNSGTIAITSAHAVALNGNTAANAGTDAYLQIGNGGGQSNLNPAAAAGGTDGGDITVTAPNGPGGSVTLTAGLGANSYAMIGNGGYAANSGVTSTAANWTITGNITVTDLALVGGQGTGNEFAVIGNGDASKNSAGNVSGNIVINANGQVTYTPGKAFTSPATIGNFTGTGTTSGTLDGATPPSQVNTNPVIIGITTTNTADTNPNQGHTDITTINTTVVPAAQDTTGGATNVPPPTASTTPGVLGTLDNGGDSSEPNTSDSATTVIADSLDGARKAGSTTLLNGMLKQTNPTSSANTVHGVPPADQDFSSWGNEALWQ
jgi:filamentous hemagglutinin family protein